MTYEQVDAVAQGRVWSGKKAKELGLVDELGNLTDAVVAAATLAELDQYETLLIEKEPSSKNIFLEKLMGNANALVNVAYGSNDDMSLDLLSATVTDKPMTQLIKQLQQELVKMNQFNDPQGLYSLCIACATF